MQELLRRGNGAARCPRSVYRCRPACKDRFLEFDEIVVARSSTSAYSLKPRGSTSKQFSEFARGVGVSQTKRPVQGGMNVRAYPVLCRAVEEGVRYGWRRAHKHTNTPDVMVRIGADPG
jgi:hypothetical protein